MERLKEECERGERRLTEDRVLECGVGRRGYMEEELGRDGWKRRSRRKI